MKENEKKCILAIIPRIKLLCTIYAWKATYISKVVVIVEFGDSFMCIKLDSLKTITFMASFSP